MALENGFHVLSDKPATLISRNLRPREIGETIQVPVRSQHNYTGYPLVKERVI